MDSKTRVAYFSSLELEGKRRPGDSCDLLYELRHGRTVCEWPLVRREGIRISPLRDGVAMGQPARSDESVADNRRSPPVLGCSLRTRHAQSRRNERWKNRV